MNGSNNPLCLKPLLSEGINILEEMHSRSDKGKIENQNIITYQLKPIGCARKCEIGINFEGYQKNML